MGKINFSRAASHFDVALQKMLIDQLMNSLNEVKSEDALSSKVLQETVALFQKELKNIQVKDPSLFQKLNLTDEELKRYFTSSKDFLKEDWDKLRILKKKLEALKSELEGEKPESKNDDLIQKERKKHVNKRFNVRDGWLPLK